MRWLVPAILVVGCSSTPAASDDDGGSTGRGTTGSATTTSDDTSVDGSGSESSGAPPPPVSGALVVLTYNVAGLPQGISSSNPEVDIPQISPLLNGYDLALVQEDFYYHADLIAEDEHPYQSTPWPEDPEAEGFGDGLNRFSQWPFGELERQQWYDCHGQLDCASDCLARKGWSFARHTLAEGAEVDVYNLHMEAGGCPEDLEIRLQATMDLAEAIAERSDGRAVIVGGDFNLNWDDPDDVTPLHNVIEGAGLTDACNALDCGDQRIDHIMVRSGNALQLEAKMWWVPDEFTDARSGGPLSDHLPVAVMVAFSNE